MSEAIDVDIETRLGAFALAVQFNVPATGVTALFGRSGAGKTSVINAVAGVAAPDRGRIQIGAECWFDSEKGIDRSTAERAVGYVFQDARLFPHLSVTANLRYGMTRAVRRGRPVRIEFDAVVELLGLSELLQRRPQRLSGGERQRVALGRALLAQPRLLLMDEPLAALDAARKAEVMPYIESLRDDFGLPILYVSHSVEEVTRLADQIVILAEGRSVASGSLLGIMGDPQYAPLMGRYEAGSVLECHVASHDETYEMTTLGFADGALLVPRVALPVGSAVRVRVRARDVALSRSRSESVSISNQLEGTVTGIIQRPGPFVEVMVDLGSCSLRALITRHSCDRLELAPRMRVWALVKSVALDRRSVAA